MNKHSRIAEQVIKRALQEKVATPSAFFQVERSVLKDYKYPFFDGVSLLKTYRRMLTQGKIEKSPVLEEVLRLNRIRTLSGVAVVAILTRASGCPASCIYCPQEKDMPKSYLADEPAVMRAVLADFDPEKQVRMRLRALEITGHPTDKVELIVIGGTFSSLDQAYQIDFLKGAFDALNGTGAKEIEEALRLNEKATHRCVGLTLETRPDFITPKEIISMRKVGATRVELGVQTIYDDILSLVNRGHSREEIIRATRLLKDAGFKVGYHIMPNLPGSDLRRDEECFRELFRKADFQPDQLKIYPCLVVKEAPLYDWWQKGKYKPYQEKELISLLARVKRDLPGYVRVSRLFRDIPSFRIEAGTRKTNLRQLVAQEMKEQGWHCSCLRCREVRAEVDLEKLKEVKLFREDYSASGGLEIFLSLEDAERKYVFSFLRLRMPSFFFTKEKHFIPELDGAAIIRELHTYGQLIPLGERGEAAQHRGLGKKLIYEAEKITHLEYGINKIAVTSAVGVRDYYRRLGYRLEGDYMVKRALASTSAPRSSLSPRCQR